MGILFGSMCGAILFIKVGRVQSFAQVVFSDPVLVRYGSGLKVSDEEDINNHEEGAEINSELSPVDDSKIPCPVLEFRIANRMSNIMGGEILDCAVNLVASVDPSQASGLTQTATCRRRRGKKGKKERPEITQITRRTIGEKNFDNVDEDDHVDLEDANGVSSGLSKQEREYVASSSYNAVFGGVDDDCGSDGNGTRRIFTKIEPESVDHPYFKRVWMIRHTLNEESPLLSNRAREMVIVNKGYWPKELNNPASVRSSIQFDKLLVNFSGTSNADANSVYAQHVYRFGDMKVGYSFCNMLYRHPDDEILLVDMSLLNDVMEQNGGGGEQLDRSVPQLTVMNEKFVELTL